MTVFITDTDALAKITEVECAGRGPGATREFTELQLGEGPTSFARFKAAHAALPKEKRIAEHGVTVEGFAAIYGMGGTDRYFVQGTGEIVFSRKHGGARVSKARDTGFSISKD